MKETTSNHFFDRDKPPKPDTLCFQIGRGLGPRVWGGIYPEVNTISEQIEQICPIHKDNENILVNDKWVCAYCISDENERLKARVESMKLWMGTVDYAKYEQYLEFGTPRVDVIPGECAGDHEMRQILSDYAHAMKAPEQWRITRRRRIVTTAASFAIFDGTWLDFDPMKRIAQLEASSTRATEEMTRLQHVIIDLVCPTCPYKDQLYSCPGGLVTCSKLKLSVPMKMAAPNVLTFPKSPAEPDTTPVSELPDVGLDGNGKAVASTRPRNICSACDKAITEEDEKQP